MNWRRFERRPEETPLEFAARLGEEFPALEADVRRLTNLYARAAYDYGALPANSDKVCLPYGFRHRRITGTRTWAQRGDESSGRMFTETGVDL